MTKQEPFDTPITGGCLCKAIRYEISMPPLKTGLCHCRSCQQSTGSGYYPFIIVKVESLKITGKFKEFTRIGNSGNKVHAGFCSSCGSTLFGRPEVWPDIQTVSASSLDNPSFFHPEMEVFTEEAQPWVAFNASTNKFKQTP